MAQNNDEKITYYADIHHKFIEQIKNQIRIYEKAKQYRFIIQLADKMKTGDQKVVNDFIDYETKMAEKEKQTLNNQIEQCRKNMCGVEERKTFIPMLELETCILTTCKLPDILYFNNGLRLNPISFFNLETDVMPIPSSPDKLEPLFSVPFDYIPNKLYRSVTHSHIALLYLSLNETIEKWEGFFKLFCKFYNERLSDRLRYLYFITIWFELRPKHFLSMTPYLLDIVENVDDGDLLIKHLKIIFDIALSRNIKFKRLPLDSVPYTHHLKYVQYSDYHKKILATDPIHMINSFKSNLLRRFDLASYKFDDSQSNRPNDSDYFQAFAICIATFLNSLSLDFLLYQPNKEPIQSSSHYLKKRSQMNSIDVSVSRHICDLFTKDQFEQVKKMVMNLENMNSQIERMQKCLYGFSTWVSTISNTNNISDILNNIEKIYNKVDQYSHDCSKFIKIHESQLKETLKPIFIEKGYVDSEPMEIPNCFLTEDQKQIYESFKEDHPEIPFRNLLALFSDGNSNYLNWYYYTEMLIKILSNKPKLKNLNISGYDLDQLMQNEDKLDQITFDLVLTERQQFVDPWAIRIVFYNLTRYAFDSTRNEDITRDKKK